MRGRAGMDGGARTQAARSQLRVARAPLLDAPQALTCRQCDAAVWDGPFRFCLACRRVDLVTMMLYAHHERPYRTVLLGHG